MKTHLRKSIGFQVGLLLSLTLAVSLGLTLWFIFLTLQRSFEELEVRETYTHLERVAEAASREIGSVGIRIKDWADWDDAAEYLANKNKKFEDANLVPEVLESMHLDAIRYYLPDRSFRGGIDRLGAEFSSMSATLDREIPMLEVLWQDPPDSHNLSGLIQLGSKLYIVGAQNVRPTDGQGAALGRLFFLKQVDDELASGISNLAKLKLQMRVGSLLPQTGPGHILPEDRRTAIPMLAAAQFSLRSDRDIDASLSLKDLIGNEVLSFHFELSRELMQVGQRTLINTALALSLSIILTLGALLFGLHRLVIHRLVTLTREVHAISSKTDKRHLVQVRGEAEIGLLAQEINRMLMTIRDQHQAIDNIIQNLSTGFVIADREARVTSSYTSCFQEMIGDSSSLKGKKLVDLLFSSSKDRDHFEAMYEQAIEQLLTEDLTLSQLPRLIDRHGRRLQMTAKGLYDEQQHMLGVLFTLTDVTEQMQTEHENTENKALLKILRSLNHFASFKESTRHGLETWRKDPQLGHKQLELRRFLHTIKGNFGIYGLQPLAELVHQIEAEPLINLPHLDAVRDTFISFLAKNRDVIGIEYQDFWQAQISLSRESLLDLRQHSSYWQSLEEAKAITHDFVDRAIRQPFREGMKPLIEESKRLANRLQKNLSIEVIGGEVCFDLEALRAVFESLVHPIRNAIDHGIETSEQRLACGKNRQGLLTFLARRTGAKSYCIEVRDDGRGVDLSKLRSVIQADPTTAAASGALSDDQVLDMIFVDGISTASVQTDISGRGVGMSALRKEVDKIGGKVHISSQAGAGCTVRIEWTEK